jgi:ADP-ribose pyrophosphatase YjhB (NUDIX family)/predicted transcriptional regulator
MSYESDIHKTQAIILRTLLFTPSANFAELQKATDLTSDHFNFHIKKLVESGLVIKHDAGYSLSQKGKEFSNRMDTDQNEIERQPKVSVALVVERNIHGRREFLTQQRLKQPYYGFYGRIGGKVQWGESFEDAAARELKEETGLLADFTYGYVFHKRDYRVSDKTLLEDKIFIVMYAKDPSGELMAEFEGGKNHWMTQAELEQQDKIFESARDFVKHLDAGIPYHSQSYFYNDDEY